ncbi:putative regulatory protein, FmdB family [Halobacillus alkaliphilus]|uniref:Putative regulatory protein, FmdB family n=1 Tax=Halobacillus alkaliphilus TaxID=396056 RepID=A0A1I2JUU7_9BACI|nr:FmdB family zinc ribbon protein [Halobacillus alkaliphilus]SFF57833.1 putative regulatory protein, FmdB family [Halobacillus alkaliphilus]
MPNYSFACDTCGEFTLWFAHMDGAQAARCPDCEGKAKRIYRAPMVQRMDSKVKKRVERGMEPRVVTRDQMPRTKQKLPTAARPWQAGH